MEKERGREGEGQRERVLRYLLFFSLSSRPSRIGARGAWIEDRGGNNSPLYLTTCQLWEGTHTHSGHFGFICFWQPLLTKWSLHDGFLFRPAWSTLSTRASLERAALLRSISSVLSLVECHLTCPGYLASPFSFFVPPLFCSPFCGQMETTEVFFHTFCRETGVEVPHILSSQDYYSTFSVCCHRATPGSLLPSEIYSEK